MAKDIRKQSVNTFTGGMVKDLDKSLYKSDMYHDAQNLRLISERDSNFGVLKNIEGFSEYDLEFDVDQLYCGHCIIRNKVVIWTTDNDGTDQIHVLTLGLDGSISTNSKIYEGDFNLDTDYKIVAVGRYESANIQKVYWVDGINNIRFANIMDVDLASKPIEYFDIIPNFSPENIEIDSVTEGGAIRAAQVQYAYILYSVNGSETTVSDSTPMIQLLKGPIAPIDPLFNTVLVSGVKDDENSKKKVTLTITNPDITLFNRIRLIGIYYSENETLPQINVIGEYGFGASITITDIGSNPIDIYTIEEFTAIKNIFSAKALESKDDHLFAANITENIDLVEYDARAYRFNGLKDTDETYVAKILGDTTIEIDAADMASDPDNWEVALDHDCINPYNDVANDLLTAANDIEDVNYQFQYTNNITGWTATDDAVLVSDGIDITSLTVPGGGTGSALSNAFSMDLGDVISFQIYTSAAAEEDLDLELVDAVSGDNAGSAYIDIDGGGSALTVTVAPAFRRINFRRIVVDNANVKIKITPVATAVAYTLMYCKGVFYGGEGPNIKYKFLTDTFLEDSGSVTTPIERLAVDGVTDIEEGFTHAYRGTIVSTDADLNSTFDNFISPFRKIKSLGLQRDEIYRVGITWLDKKNNPLFVDWIGDIRTPKCSEYGFGLFYLGQNPPIDGLLYMFSLRIKVEVKLTQELIDKGITGYKIVRVKRDRSDRTILDCGLMGALVNRDVPGSSLNFPSDLDQGANSGGGYTYRDDYREYVSPDINFNRDDVKLESDWYVPYYNLDYYVSRLVTDDDDPIAATENNTLNFKKYTNAVHDLELGVYETTKERLFSDLGYNASENDDAYYITVNNVKVYNYSEGAMSENANDQARGTCLIVNGSAVGGNSFDVAEERHALYCYRKNNIIPYGGNGYYSRLASTYISASPYTTLLDNVLDDYVSTFATGDTFIYLFEHLRTMMSTRPANDNSNSLEVIYFPVESTFNDHARNGRHVYKNYFISPAQYPTLSDMVAIHETPGVYQYGINGATTGSFFTQDYYLYDYDFSYSIESDLRKYFVKPFDFQNIDTVDVRVKASQKKINNELSDSWAKFLPFDFKDVDSRYGPVNNLLTFNNRLMYWQDHGFGILSVNERSLISDNNPGELVLGTGGILDRYDYVSETIGNVNKFGLAKSQYFVYWIDNFKKDVYRFAEKVEPIGSIKYIKSYLNNYDIIHDVLLGYDNEYNELLFTISKIVTIETPQEEGPPIITFETVKETLVFNERMDVFQSFYTIYPTYYINHELGLLSGHLDASESLLHKHNDGDKCIFDDDTAFDSTLKILCNNDYQYIKVFDNLILSTNVKLDGIEYFNKTVNEIRVYNDYQNTDWRTLVYKTDSGGFPEIPFERRERHFSLAIPRNIVSTNVIENPNIFDSANLDETTRFKERIRDSHIYVDFIYENEELVDGSPSIRNRELSINYIVTKYRISYR